MIKSEFTSRVMSVMNEPGLYDAAGNSFVGADAVGIDRLIEGSYVDAWRRVAKVAPRTWLGNKSFTASVPVPNLTDGTGYVALPTDFYLLSKFKMNGWKVAAMEAALNNSRVANMQSNEWTRGSTMRPAVVIDNVDVDGVITPVLYYYSLQKGLTAHLIDTAIYVPTVADLKDKSDDYDLGISDQIIAPLAYLSAATVFTILEKPTIAAALEARAEAMLPGLISLKGTNATVKQ
jgi:hypothetical protein